MELLFDLCFVVAVAQVAAGLHNGLADGETRASIGAYLMIFGAVWWAWMNFTWFAPVLILSAVVPLALGRYGSTEISALGGAAAMATLTVLVVKEGAPGVGPEALAG